MVLNILGGTIMPAEVKRATIYFDPDLHKALKIKALETSRSITGIPKNYLVKILEKIERLKENPRPEGSEKLTGKEFYRIRQGIYRIVYFIQDTELTIWVVKVGHRKEIYRKLGNKSFHRIRYPCR